MTEKKFIRNIEIEESYKLSFILTLLLLSILWIFDSPFLQNVICSWILAVGLVMFTFSKYVLGYQYPIWYSLLILILIFTGSMLVNDSDRDISWWGVLILLLTMIGDGLYLGYLYLNKRVDACKGGIWAGLLGTSLSAVMLILAIVRY